MISILFQTTPNPLQVPIGQLIGCFNAWYSVFKPEDNFLTSPIPKNASHQSLIPLINTGPHRIFGLDVILRSITKHHIPNGVIQDVAQAMPQFVDANNEFLNNSQALSINGNNVQGVILTQAALAEWAAYSRAERLAFLEFGNERLRWVCEYTGLEIDGA